MTVTRSAGVGLPVTIAGAVLPPQLSLLLLLIFLLLLPVGHADAGPGSLTILHTNDLHSRLDGFYPSVEYTPASTGDDATRGGWARLATAIQRERRAARGPVVLVDAGDFSMGTLYHAAIREQATELRLMHRLGYDAVAIGNHEFDMRSEGLARMVEAAATAGACPHLLLANALIASDDPRDDRLAGVFAAGHIRPYRVVEAGGLRIGLFGLLGRDAAEKSPFARPVRFAPAAPVAREMTRRLREVEHADVVIALSHSGLGGPALFAEDRRLAAEVPGIDVIVSGHSHRTIPAPIVVGDCVIVIAGSFGQHLGVLELEIWRRRVQSGRHRHHLVEIDDRIPGDPGVQALIEAAREPVEASFLAATGVGFDEVVAETAFDLERGEASSNLGDLVADAMLWAVRRHDPDPPVLVAVESNGLIRAPVRAGRSGRVTVADLYTAVPMGIGEDDRPGYPLVTFWVTGAEIRQMCEVPASVASLKGSDYFLHVAGLGYRSNPWRMFLDRVTAVWSEDAVGRRVDLPADDRLHRVAINLYNASFIGLIGSFTRGLVAIVPKDRDGRPISDLAAFRVDRDPDRPGIQELKEFDALLEYVRQFPDVDGDGIPDVPERYRVPQDRAQQRPSASLGALLGRPGRPTVAAATVLGLFLASAVGAALVVARRLRARRRRTGPVEAGRRSV